MICFILLKHLIPLAFSWALAKAGRSIDAKTAMIAITTSNSIRVKPLGRCALGSVIAFFMIDPQVSTRLQFDYWTLFQFPACVSPRYWQQRFLYWYVIHRTLTSVDAPYVPY